MFPPCCLTSDPTMVEVTKLMATSFKRSHEGTATLSAPDPVAGHYQPTPPPEILYTPRQDWVSLLWGHCSYIYYCGQESLRRNGVALIVNKIVQNAVLGCSLKNDGMISVYFQGKPFSITIIQVCAPTSNAEEADFEWFHDDLQDLLELTPKKGILFIIGDWNTKVGSQETPGVTGKFGLGVQNEEGQRLIEFCQENTLVIANTFFQQHKRRFYTWTSPDGQYQNQIDYIL